MVRGAPSRTNESRSFCASRSWTVGVPNGNGWHRNEMQLKKPKYTMDGPMPRGAWGRPGVWSASYRDVRTKPSQRHGLGSRPCYLWNTAIT